MQKLGIDEGDFVLFRSVILPQGKFARFQPQSLQWIEISENERRQMYIFFSFIPHIHTSL